jgi:hypothetical protein
MPFEADPGKAADSPMTYGEHARKMSAVHKLYDGAVKRGESIAKLESDLAEASAKLSNMPDAAKAAKRLEKAELAAADWESKFATATSEYTTEKALLTAGIVDPEDMALVRYKYEQSGGDDFGKYLATGARTDKHLAALFAAPAPELTPEPESAARPAPVPTNGGITPPPPPGAVRDRSWLAGQPNAWKNDRSNWKEIDLINGIEPRS